MNQLPAELLIFTDPQIVEQLVFSSNLGKEGPTQKVHTIPLNLKCSKEGGMQQLFFPLTVCNLCNLR